MTANDIYNIENRLNEMLDVNTYEKINMTPREVEESLSRIERARYKKEFYESMCCNFTVCRYNESGVCGNKVKREECIEVSRKVLCMEEENKSEEEKKYRDFLKTENKHYVYINNFLATPMRYKILGMIYAYNTVPVASIRFENGILAERNIDELMSCYTLENCIKQCEQLNEEMKEHRESWSEDCWRLEQLMQEVGHD